MSLLALGQARQHHALHLCTHECVQQVDGKRINFLTDARPSKRAVNLHASWAYKQASKRATASGTVVLSDIDELPESVWSQQSWKQHVEEWLATVE
jgi:hypothetical protein